MSPGAPTRLHAVVTKLAHAPSRLTHGPDAPLLGAQPILSKTPLSRTATAKPTKSKTRVVAGKPGKSDKTFAAAWKSYESVNRTFER